ncbi:Hypothetical predicted protein [Cloeon dipterum]|uniref:G-protein coupled receptors family 2 profile 2 domain-containing protein n=1 Tax=Cloeon dipterum TaxID=197152 RepID=A0A8S1DSY0_9INSE|nr:Hypothetical predicted protein [Cloeon dipterum]
MWMIRVISLAVLFAFNSQRVCVGAQNKDWQCCGPYRDVPGYPVGCKSSPTDKCATQSDKCRELVCNEEVIKYALQVCWSVCDRQPVPVGEIFSGNYSCWCSDTVQFMCTDKSTQLAKLAKLWDPKRQQTRIVNMKYRHDNRSIWGVTVKINGQSLLPVFCNQKKNYCKSTFYSLPKDFSNKFSTKPESEIPNETSCEVTGHPPTTTKHPLAQCPSAGGENQSNIILKLHQDTSEILRLISSSSNQIKKSNQTDGMILADEIEWNDWDIEITGVILNADVGRNNFGQVLYKFENEGLSKSYRYGFVQMKSDIITFVAIQNMMHNRVANVSRSHGCVKNDQYGIKWECSINEICEYECPLQASGCASWSCGEYQAFETEWPDYTRCSNIWISETEQLIEDNEVTSFTLVGTMSLLVKDTSLFGHEIEKTIHLTDKSHDILMSELNEQQHVGDPEATKLFILKSHTNLVMDVINNFVTMTKPWQQLQQNKTSSLGWELIELVEKFGFNVTGQAKNINVNFNMTSIKEHYFMESQYLRHKQGENHGNIIRFPMLKNNTWSSSIVIRELPNRTFRNDAEYTDIEAVGQIIPMAYAEKFFPAQFNRMNDTKKRMNSGLIHLALYGPDRIPIEGVAAFVTFKHSREAKGPIYETIWHQLYPGEKPTAIEGTEQCAYWVNSLSEWDTEGCRKVKSDRWSTECECNHTGPFVLISGVHVYAKDVIMEIVNIVFSTLSLLSLTLMLIVLYFFEEVQEERNAIGKHLCLCLLIGNIMALTVLDRSYFQLSREMCVGAAVCLHYVFLAAFMWMAIEGHHLYRMVMRVFDSGRDFSKIYLWTGYGTPLLIVAATGITTAALQDYGYADDELCWLSTPLYIWTFMGPVFIITVMKLVVLALALKVTLANATQQIKTFRNRVKIWIMGWFLLSLLLIVTWLIGFFYIEFYHSFSYAFFALNGLQGVVIFLIRAVFNEKVRTTIKKRSKESPVMDRLYKIFWNQDSRNQAAASQPSPWVLGSSIISQEDIASVAATSDWGSISTISVTSTIDGDQKPYQNPVKPLKFVFSGDLENFQPWLKKKSNKEEALEQSVLKNLKSVEIKETWNNLRSDSIISEIPEKEMHDQRAEADSDKPSNE